MTTAVVTSETMISLGISTSLPATLANEHVSFRFVSHATYGVTMDTMTQLDDGPAFVWTNAQQSDDGTVTGQLWRIVQDSGNEHNAEHNAEHGMVGEALDPTTDVAVTTMTDADGRPALAFRWEDLALATSGTVDVTMIVALGDGDVHARFTIHVDRHGTAADAIDHVACPILAFQGPVPARSGSTHADSQVRARVLADRNTPLSAWSGDSELTQHPRGYSANGATIPTQRYQFDALCAMDPDDQDSERQVAVLSSADVQGYRKQFLRSGVLDGDTLLYRWEHRYIPSWASWPILDSDATTRFGNLHFSRYPVLVGCFRAPTKAWDFSAAVWYRENVGEQMAAPPRRTDAARTDLSRGAPLVLSDEDTANMNGTTLGAILSTWTSELREQTGADVAFAQWNTLLPERSAPTPALDFTEIRGVNYLPLASTSHCLHLSLVPIVASAGRPTTSGGFFHASHLTDELDVLESVGFNNIRLWGSLMGYLCNPAGYMASLKTVAAECHARGIGITYILFNQIPAGAATAGGSAYTFFSAIGDAPSTLIAALWAQCDGWQGNDDAPQNMPTDETDVSHWPEPMTGDEWIASGRYGEWSNEDFQQKVGEYVRAIADFFVNDSDGAAAFHSVDLYNEVNLIFYAQDGTELASRELVLDFICKVESAMRTIFPTMATTVGWAGNPSGRDSSLPGMTTQLAQRGCYLSYGSMHAYNYDATPEQFAAISAVLGTAKAETDALNIPLVFSEFYVRPENAGQMADYAGMIVDNGPGWQVWCYIQNNAYRDSVQSGTWDYHGFSYPFDGLVTCSKPALQILTTDTLEFNPTGGEHNEEHSDEHNNGAVREAADRQAILDLMLATQVVP